MRILFPELDTPSLLIEKSILEKNISDMQTLMDKYNVKLRPHIKTHKSLELAKMQINAGAVGIACAKVSEAMVFADAGFKDIQIANILIGDKKLENLFYLQKNIDKLSCCVDSIDNARILADFFDNRNKKMDVMIIVDCGYHRCGFSDYSQILKLAQYIKKRNSLNLIGITTHAGQSYSAQSNEERLNIASHEGNLMVHYANKLRKDGIAIQDVTIGSNPTARESCKVKGVTEIRSGNYIFNDLIQVSLGTVKINRCALTVLSQVISIPSKTRVIIDAGSKTFSSDKGAHGNENLIGFGHIIGKNAIIERLSEEHGIIKSNNEKFKIEERLRIIPNHACTTTNSFEKAYIVDRNKVIKEISISARGKIK
ncbi:D-TA family PLP-dependent enzyme [Bacteroidetes/Chlorobi group bacterium ChocPot_Mid]|nr:MAG: D-TA family PLP-dependent enzyme [Bacteroidetes/Chlorobi group bacterium ChocPot_Mid]